MPNLKQATLRPSNLAGIIDSFQPANGPSFPSDPGSSIPDYAPLSLAPPPSIISTDSDQQKQFYRRGVSQYRIPPLPSKADPAVNASIQSIAKTVAQQVATESGLSSVGLTMPGSVFATPVSGSPVTEQEGSGTLAPAFIGQPQNTVFAGPATKFGNLVYDGLVFAQATGGSISVPATPTQPNDLAILLIPSVYFGTSVTQPDSSWTQIEAITPGGGFNGGVFWKLVPNAGPITGTAKSNNAGDVMAAAILMLQAAGNGATPTIRQSKINSGVTFPAGVTFTSNVLAGSVVIVTIQNGNASTGFVNPTSSYAVTDSQGNTYTPVARLRGPAGGGPQCIDIFATLSTSAGALTVSVSQSVLTTSNTGLVAMEITGVQNSSSLPVFRPLVAADIPPLPFTDLTGNIATSQMNGGTGASTSTFWRGDGTWAVPPFSNFGSVNPQTADYIPVASDAGKLIAFKPTSAQTTPTFVQGTSTSTGAAGSTEALAFNSNVSAGHLLLCAFGWGNSSGSNGVTPSTVTDTLGNVWTQVGSTIYTPSSTFGSFGFAVYQTISKATGANTVTFTISSSQTFRRMMLLEYTNPPAGTLVDVIATNTGTGTAFTSGNITTTSNNDLILELGQANSGATMAAGSGYNLRIGSPTSNGLYGQDKALATAGTTSFSGTLSSSSDWASVILGIFPESGATLYLPNPPISSSWAILVQDYGSNPVTISRNQLQIDGAASNVALNSGKGAAIFTDGTNYFTFRGGS